MAATEDSMKHLSKAQLSTLVKRLERERERLSGKLNADGNGGTSANVEDPLLRDPEDFADMAQDITNEDTELALSENDRRLLTQVEHALQRIADGTYGLSDVTGKPIPFERLDAIPWATTNVEDSRDH